MEDCDNSRIFWTDRWLLRRISKWFPSVNSLVSNVLMDPESTNPSWKWLYLKIAICFLCSWDNCVDIYWPILNRSGPWNRNSIPNLWSFIQYRYSEIHRNLNGIHSQPYDLGTSENVVCWCKNNKSGHVFLQRWSLGHPKWPWYGDCYYPKWQ